MARPTAMRPAATRPEPAVEAIRPDPRVRTRRSDVDPFYIDPSLIPDGSSYEYKRVTTFGKEDVDHQMLMEANGWLPVPAKRHPSLMPKGAGGNVRRGEMVLMERPMELTKEALLETRLEARRQITDNARRLGEVPEDLDPEIARHVRGNIRKSYESVEIPA